MAAAYENMVSSIWSATAAVVNSITPSATDRPLSPQERDIYTGAWDGTGTILPDSNPSERQLYLSAQLRSPILPLDLYYLLYLLERFEQVGIDLEGWNGTTSKPVGDSKPRVIMQDNSQKRHSIAIVTPTGVNSGLPNSASFSSFPPPAAATNGGNAVGATSGLKSSRPESIRSFQSAALSTLTLITGWKQWSTAANSGTSNLTITDDILFIQKFMRHIPSLRLCAKIPPGDQFQGKGRIEGFQAEAILTLFNHGRPVLTPNDNGGSSNDDSTPNGGDTLLLLPLAATFPALTHLELHKIPPDSIEGWEVLMKQLKSLVIIQSGMEDVHEIMVKSVIDSERRRRQRTSREKSRAVLIKREQQEALKDAALTSQELDGDSTAKDETTSNGSVSSFSVASGAGADTSESDAVILSSLKMWPLLRHLSLSDNSLPTLTHNDTFIHTQSIVSLDLSHNLFLSPPSALIHLHNLHNLNLSYNMISGVQSIYQILGNIAILDLRGNRLESLSGLERLWNLEKVDVRENHLDEAAEVGRLAALPGIREVWSERNPFCMIQVNLELNWLDKPRAGIIPSFASYSQAFFIHLWIA
jgi:Leucine-rich repeat (LRR) protein